MNLKMKDTYPDPNTLWRHYKGGLYEIMFLSKHTESDEVLVNYRSLHFGSYNSRPLDVFKDMVISDGMEVPRFTPENEGMYDF